MSYESILLSIKDSYINDKKIKWSVFDTDLGSLNSKLLFYKILYKYKLNLDYNIDKNLLKTKYNDEYSNYLEEIFKLDLTSYTNLMKKMDSISILQHYEITILLCVKEKIKDIINRNN